jgi:hypothetical protein
MYAAIFWDIASCSPYVNRRSSGMYHLHHLLYAGFLHDCFLALKMEVSPKRWFNGLHGAICDKMATFVIAAVITSNPTSKLEVWTIRKYTQIYPVVWWTESALNLHSGSSLWQPGLNISYDDEISWLFSVTLVKRRDSSSTAPLPLVSNLIQLIIHELSP